MDRKTLLQKKTDQNGVYIRLWNFHAHIGSNKLPQIQKSLVYFSRIIFAHLHEHNREPRIGQFEYFSPPN